MLTSDNKWPFNIVIRKTTRKEKKEVKNIIKKAVKQKKVK